MTQFMFLRQPTRSALSVRQAPSQRAGASQGRPVQAGTVHRRLGLLHITLFFAFWVTVICARLVWLQVIHHKDYVERAAKQQQRTFEVAPRRGVLYDRNLHELAMTVLADSVYVVPSQVAERTDPDGQAKRQALAVALAKVLHTDPTDRFTSAHQIAARINASRNFAWVARKLDPEQIARVKALNLKGVYFQKEFKRFYPNSQLSAQVLGYVGTDDNGLGGIERKFDRSLHGSPGRMLTAVDARRHVLGSEEHEPDPGQNLVLTLDENIQFMAERALDTALARTHALNGTVVVQDPYSGQILALAIRPTFNPNDFRHATTGLLKNHAVSDVYEPGSTFKLVTYSAALEQKVTTPDQMIDCQGGKMELAGRIIHDSHPNGVLTVSQALWESSDVAAAKLALRMGSEKFVDYIHDYGFGQRSNIELPAETRGLLAPIRKWSGSSIGSIAMGQEVGVTPVQLVTMVSTIANGGVYLPPHILMNPADKTPATLHASPFHPQAELPETLPPGAHRVISTMTAAQMRKMMEGVVLYGTAKNEAKLNGYTSAGKTGTAQKIDVQTHRYSKTKYVASFVGIAPVNNPAISVAVIIDSPEGSHFGNTNAGPVFTEVAQEVLEYLGVPHDTALTTPADLAKQKQEPAPKEATPDHAENLDALFAEVNNLPADDPLRNSSNNTAQQLVPGAANEVASASGPVTAKSSSEQDESEATTSKPSPLRRDEVHTSAPPVFLAKAAEPDPSIGAPAAEHSPHAPGHGVVVAAGNQVDVPSFLGKPLRVAVETAGSLGLALQIVGSGIAREQVPAAGSVVPAGTEVVVRFSR